MPTKPPAGRIPEQTIQTMVSQADLAGLIGEVVQLKKSGQNYSGLCPFHDEKTPSFTVSSTKNFYYCFGCNASGNALSFLMNFHHFSFVDACETLAKRLNITLDYQQLSPGQQQHRQQRTQLGQLTEFAKHYFVKQLQRLNTQHPVQRYLNQRNITQTTLERFQVGYAPAGWEHLKNELSTQGLDQGHSLEVGLLTKNDRGRIYDRFRDRLMFPILDTQHRCVAFGGRVLNQDQPKYLNSPESSLFQKRYALFGLAQVLAGKQLERILIVEGYFDVLRLHQVGIPQAVAALGTAFSQAQIVQLFRHTDTILAAFDGDRAGEQAAWRLLELALPIIDSHQNLEFLFLPAGEDPDSYVQTHGKAQFLVLLDQASSLSDFFIAKITQGLNPAQLDDQAKILKRGLQLVGSIEKSLLQEVLLKQLASLTNISIERLAAQMRPQALPEQTTYGSHHDHSLAQRAAKQFNHGPQTQQRQYNYDQNNSYEQHNNYSNTQRNTRGNKRYRDFSPRKINLPSTHHLTDALLRLLLQQPQLAQKFSLALEEIPPIPNIKLFIAIFEQLHDVPDTSPAYLMGLWYDRPEGAHLAKLAAQELLAQGASLDLESEFAGGLSQLEDLALNHALGLIAQQKPLDREKIKRLLAQKAAQRHTPIEQSDNLC